MASRSKQTPGRTPGRRNHTKMLSVGLNRVQLRDVLLRELLSSSDRTLEIGEDTCRCDGLGQDHDVLRHQVPKQDVGDLQSVLFGDGRRGLVLPERGVGRSERRVRLDGDALGLAEVDELGLVVVQVKLELVHGGDNGGVGEDLAELRLRCVGDTDSLDFTWGRWSYDGLERKRRVYIPDFKSSSICFQVSFKGQSRRTSREPSARVGKMGWLPLKLRARGQ